MKSVYTLIILLLFCYVSYAQVTDENLNSMLATEYKFAASAAKVGMHDAFLKYISNDGILFKPTPVNGKKYLTENNQPSTGLLSWYPSYAFISKAGDMGLSTGPWEYRKTKKDSSASSYGNFCTIWEKQSNGEWKFAIDCGNDNPKPVEEISALTVDTAKANILSKSGSVNNEKPDELIAVDKQINLISSSIGITSIYQKLINEETRLLRDGSHPIIGSISINDYFSKEELKYNFIPAGGKISTSKDFGFTYGELEITNSQNNSSEKFSYVHVWKKAVRGWNLLVDVTNKIPK